MKLRIGYLDALRGAAILMVALYHAYIRWPDYFAYGDRYQSIAVLRYGFLGVDLFFLISGFVILMTLEKCTGAGDFLKRRWLRLFPGMLICSVLVFSTAALFPARPSGTPTWVGLLPGLTFIEPDWWAALLGVKVEPLEGTFWSLFVEFKFYVFAAFTYFTWGKRGFIGALFIAFLLPIAVAAICKFLPTPFWLAVQQLLHHLSFDDFGWFAAGALLYLYSSTRDRRYLLLGTAMACLSAVALRKYGPTGSIAVGVVAAFFVATVLSESLQRWLDNPLLRWLGFVSYPLYLIHENALVALLQASRQQHVVPDWSVPIFLIAALAVIAHLVIHFLEEPLAQWLKGRRPPPKQVAAALSRSGRNL